MKLERRVPSLDEHRTLSLAVGWEGAFDWDTLQRSLDASLAGAVVVDEGVTVGI